MYSSRRHPLVVLVLLCALAVLVARPTDAADHATGDGPSGISAQVARLYEEAAVATRQYESVRQEAEAQRAKAERYEALLDRERREIAVLHKDLGRIARAQYRTGGGVPLTAQIILADSPDELMRGQRGFSQAQLAVGNALDKSRRAETRLAADEARAEAAWQDLE